MMATTTSRPRRPLRPRRRRPPTGAPHHPHPRLRPSRVAARARPHPPSSHHRRPLRSPLAGPPRARPNRPRRRAHRRHRAPMTSPKSCSSRTRGESRARPSVLARLIPPLLSLSLSHLCASRTFRSYAHSPCSRPMLTRTQSSQTHGRPLRTGVYVCWAPQQAEAEEDELARTHEQLISTILDSEEVVIAAHRQQVDDMMELVKQVCAGSSECHYARCGRAS